MLYFKIYLLVLHLKHDFMKKVKENFYQNKRKLYNIKKILMAVKNQNAI